MVPARTDPVGYLLTELIDFAPDGGDGTFAGWWRAEIVLGGFMPALLLALLWRMPESPAFYKEGGDAHDEASAADEGSALVTTAAEALAAERRRCCASVGLLVAVTLGAEGAGTPGVGQYSAPVLEAPKAAAGGGSFAHGVPRFEGSGAADGRRRTRAGLRPQRHACPSRGQSLAPRPAESRRVQLARGTASCAFARLVF